ncbi:hypothetical protein CBR_g23234 [Chara braunii]|uniref:Uncharacterized protein n=1 Tax=Chara braunii TaxID=69332 RepID=A0A388JV72_CHABU|nr:hypothetical protein CBR_g23234 [Chara braunii]|eukprot:GBG61719.1 hypothetical protein CBR_g23234 [Chara braunii]
MTFQNEGGGNINHHPQRSIGKVRKLSSNTIDEISEKVKDEVNENMNVMRTENDKAVKAKVKKVNMLKLSGVNIVNDEKAVQEETSGLSGDMNLRSLINVISLSDERVSLPSSCDGDKNSQMISHFHEDEHFGVEKRMLPPLSDFMKTTMPRGGRGTRPPRRPLGASGDYERHESHQREHTPVYDDGDIELFLDDFRGYAEHMGWTVAQRIERLRGVGRFEEPIVQIRIKARTWPEVELRMQELRPSPMGQDGVPIRLEIGNVEEFIPEPSIGKAILEPEEAKAKREAQKEAFEFRAPTEFAAQSMTSFGSATESWTPRAGDRPRTAINEPALGSDEGSMDVLLEAVNTLQEEASLFMPKQRVEEPHEGETMVAMEGVCKGRPRRLDTPEYRPEGTGMRTEPITQGLEVRLEEPMDMPQSYEMTREASETPSSPGSQRKKKRSRKSYDATCFFCKKEEHQALQYPKFLKDKAAGKVTEEGGRMYDRQGRVVERNVDGGRDQLYRQNQEEMSE